MINYELVATREACQDRQMGRCSAPTKEAARDWAQAIVDKAEEDGTWPQGYDALVRMDSRGFLYTDEREAI